MTIFANCREKFTKDAYPYGEMFRTHEDIPEDEINFYWDKKLKGDKAEYVAGYDFAIQEALNFFNNIDSDNLIGKYIGKNEVEEIQGLAEEIYAMLYDAEEKHTWDEYFEVIDKASSSVGKVLLSNIVDMWGWTERNRNMLITALIDKQEKENEK